MKFPWVGRAALEAAQREAADWQHRCTTALAQQDREPDLYATVQILSGSNAKLTALSESLAAEVLGLRAQLAAVPSVPPPKPHDEVSKVIREQAEGNVQLAQHLRTYASQLRREGKTTDQIVGALVRWTTTEPDVMPVER